MAIKKTIRLIFLLGIIFFYSCKPSSLAQNTNGDSSLAKIDPKLLFNPHRSVKIVEKSRNVWINNAADSLLSLYSQDTIEVLLPKVIDLADIKMVSYRVHHLSRIGFKDGEEILIMIHSAHEDMEIGDVSVAVDKNKNIYVNLGHVCGGIIHFMYNVARIPLKPIDFFENFYSDTDEARWIKWK